MVSEQTSNRELCLQMLALGLTVLDVAGLLGISTSVLRNEIRGDGRTIGERFPDRPDPRHRELVRIAVMRRIAVLEEEPAGADAEDPARKRLCDLLVKWLEAQPDEEAYRAPRHERGASILELFLTLGWSYEAVSQATGWSLATIRNDARDFGGAKAFPSRPANHRAAHRATLRAYAETEAGQRHPDGIADLDWYKDTLARWLRLPEVIAHLGGVLQSAHFLASPRCMPGEEPWLNLYLDVIEYKPPAKPQKTHIQIENLLRCYWSDLRSGRIGTVPETFEDLCEQLAECPRTEGMQEIWPIAWSSEDSEILHKLVQELPSGPQKGVLVERYGLESGRPATMAQIEQRMGIGRSRPGQLRDEALEQLKRLVSGNDDFTLLRWRMSAASERRQQTESIQERLDRLRGWVEDARQRCRRLEEVLRDYGGNPASSTGSWNEHLFKRVDELELSVRSANCLRDSGIEWIWQLVEKSEAEMLKTKNFGRKSLNEIKEILAELGLELGMKLHCFPKDQFD